MNKFQIDDKVAMTKTQDNILGIVIAIHKSLKFLYNPMQAKSLAEQWSEMAHVSEEEICSQFIYGIKLNVSMLPGPEEKARECYRDKFIDEESFQAWLEKQKVSMFTTFENDLVPASSIIPDTLPEGI